jgi:hypothetical protein
MREKENFRDVLEGLRERFPDREAISIAEASKLIGAHRQTLLGTKGFPCQRAGNKYVIPIVALARWLS